jgi:hypothetical protein
MTKKARIEKYTSVLDQPLKPLPASTVVYFQLEAVALPGHSSRLPRNKNNFQNHSVDGWHIAAWNGIFVFPENRTAERDMIAPDRH